MKESREEVKSDGIDPCCVPNLKKYRDRSP